MNNTNLPCEVTISANEEHVYIRSEERYAADVTVSLTTEVLTTRVRGLYGGKGGRAVMVTGLLARVG